MKVPLNWLREYIDFHLSPSELAERITMAGLEVAGIRVYGLPVPAGIRIKTDEQSPVWDREKIVTAKVLKVEKHPNADKLKLVTVDYGRSESKIVVTGAPNINVGDVGQIVILALTGAVLFDGHATPKKLMELKPTQLRGVPSDSMLCSGYELGTTEDHEGIILLPDDAPIGMPLVNVMGDIVFDIDILPNMARCLALLGVAREVAAITGNQVKLPTVEMARTGAAIAGRVNVEIANPKLSARYAAFLIEDIKIRPSPVWMQTRLTYAGMRPISNVVDITNYVMLEWGQPLHAFDYDVLKERAAGKTPTITVRPAKAGETLVTLDKIERKLSPEHLVIADTVGPIALAGVMGGLETEVTNTTKNILLESANFDFVSVRRTAKALDLPSEASYRFSRGIHPETVIPAGQRAAQLLAQHAGGTVASDVVDCYPSPRPKHVIELKLSEVRRILGIEIPAHEATQILTALDFQVELAGSNTLRVTAPNHRVDLQEGQADLIEELARIHGYDRLPSTLLADPLPAQIGNEALEREERVRDLLAGYGLQEFITYSLTTPEREASLSPPNIEYVRLVNPITNERCVLRHTILAGLLECVAANLRHMAMVKAFEIGSVYLPNKGMKLPEEPTRLGIVMTGPREEISWANSSSNTNEMDFFDLKGVVESLVADLHLPDVSVRAIQPGHLHPGKAAQVVVAGKSVGVFGELHPKVAAAFELGGRSVMVGEFDLNAILTAIPSRYQFQSVPRFPAALRDVAMIVSEDTTAEKVTAEIRAGGGELLANVRLFDVYRGGTIPAGSKSLAFALSYQAADRTLSDKDIDKAHRKVEERLKHVLKASIRGKDDV